MAALGLREKSDSLSLKIIELQDENGYWDILKPGDKYYPDYQFYCPNYTSTLWTMIFLADINCSVQLKRLEKPLEGISKHLFDEENGIYSIGKSHFPIPCLNGNMLYLHSYFGFGSDKDINGIVDFFTEYQRFDDGDFQTPSAYPYFRNRSCYGQHSCYWGVVKLLKGLSFIPQKKRSSNAKILMDRCIDFILKHEVCYSSHNPEKFLQPQISKLTFPNMYKSDFLEILWLLKLEGVQDKKMNRALKLLQSRMQPEGHWFSERKHGKLIISFGERTYSDAFITSRAKEVMKYYFAD